MPNYLSKLDINGVEFIIKDRTITPEQTPDRKILLISDEEINRGGFKTYLENYANFKWAQDAGAGFTMYGAGTGENFTGILNLLITGYPDEVATITDIIVLGGAHEVHDSDTITTALNTFSTTAFSSFPKLSRLYIGFIPNTHLTGSDYDDLMDTYEIFKNYASAYRFQYIQNIELIGRNNAYVQDPNDSFPIGLNAYGMASLAAYMAQWLQGSPIPDTFPPVATTLGGDDYVTTDNPVLYTQIIKGMLYVYLTVQQDFSLKDAYKTGTWNASNPMVIGSVATSGYCFGHQTNRMSGYTSVPTVYVIGSPAEYYPASNPFRIKDGEVIINPGIFAGGHSVTGTINRIVVEKFTQIGDAMYS